MTITELYNYAVEQGIEDSKIYVDAYQNEVKVCTVEVDNVEYLLKENVRLEGEVVIMPQENRA